MGTPLPLPKRGAEPPQIKMSLGMELGLGPGDFVLDFDIVAPSPKGGQTPNFRPMFIAAKRLNG